MEDCIICQINLFTMQQEIQLIHDKSCYKLPVSDINNIPAIIAEYCNAQNINKVHLFGQADYLQGLMENIKAVASINFNMNNLEFKINE